MPENLEVDEKVTTFAHVNETSRDGAEVARWAHNPKVVRSSRAPATKKRLANANLFFSDSGTEFQMKRLILACSALSR